MKKSNHTILLSLVLALAISALSGCQTTEGVGEDVENLGESIQDAAN